MVRALVQGQVKVRKGQRGQEEEMEEIRTPLCGGVDKRNLEREDGVRTRGRVVEVGRTRRAAFRRMAAGVAEFAEVKVESGHRWE